ncbi:MAG: DnaJ domain-containing protein, partial [Microcoleus sp. SM1_3_4]|nr:DnaJ domain-containing protein [Microcoleus sp. SM1_3_4]
MNDLDQYYKVLELPPGASPEEITQAYKDLAFIWHPDRIPKDNPRLLQKAEEKIKELNQAREQLRSIQRKTHGHTQQKTAHQQNSQYQNPQYRNPYHQNSQYRNSQQQHTQQQNTHYQNTQYQTPVPNG